MTLDYNAVTALLENRGTLQADLPEDWNDYLYYRKEIYESITPKHVQRNLISEANYVLRSQFSSGEDIGIIVTPGDICYLDYGQSYLNEMGYQHFGLVMSICKKKALVIPMTSNPVQYATAYDAITNPGGKKHLMRIGKPKGLVRDSVLFLNDSRYINTARIIEVKSRIDPDDPLFIMIQSRFIQVLLSSE